MKYEVGMRLKRINPSNAGLVTISQILDNNDICFESLRGVYAKDYLDENFTIIPFKKGDKVYSSECGSGIVTDNIALNLVAEDYIHVDFKEYSGNLYNRFTGKRAEGCGIDKIIPKPIRTFEEVSFIAPPIEAVNIIYVKFHVDDDASKAYLYKVPFNQFIKKGEKVFVEAQNGKRLVTTISESTKISKDAFEIIAVASGCKLDNMKSVLGYAKEVKKYELVEFN